MLTSVPSSTKIIFRTGQQVVLTQKIYHSNQATEACTNARPTVNNVNDKTSFNINIESRLQQNSNVVVKFCLRLTRLKLHKSE